MMLYSDKALYVINALHSSSNYYKYLLKIWHKLKKKLSVMLLRPVMASLIVAIIYGIYYFKLACKFGLTWRSCAYFKRTSI